AATNPAFENLRGAWEQDQHGGDLPVAIYPTYVHPRLRAQRACFTIHGKRKDGLNSLVRDTLLKRYDIDPARRTSTLTSLSSLGVAAYVACPAWDGLATQLKARFPKQRKIRSAASPSVPPRRYAATLRRARPRWRLSRRVGGGAQTAGRNK